MSTETTAPAKARKARKKETKPRKPRTGKAPASQPKNKTLSALFADMDYKGQRVIRERLLTACHDTVNNPDQVPQKVICRDKNRTVIHGTEIVGYCSQIIKALEK